jgi:hypothetical protein
MDTGMSFNTTTGQQLNTTFGYVNGTNPPRIIQLSVRVLF